MKNPNVLLLADTMHQAGAVQDHIKAVTASTDDFNWHVLNPLTLKTIDKLDLTLFDAVGVHFSIKLHGTYYLSLKLKRKLAAYTGLKFVFLQDEYQKVNQMQTLLYRLGFHLLFTIVDPKRFDTAYPDARLKTLKKVQVLTGYVNDAMKHLVTPPVAKRPIDVSYRSRHGDYRLGQLGYEKTFLAAEFPRRVAGEGLALDISAEESDRVYGDAWLDLLMQSKVVLGTESGASIWDRDGSVAKKVNRFLRKHPNAAFDTVFEAVLKPYEGNVMYNAISPRVFEAAATKTPMVMFVGEYNGICERDVHYIGLEKDFSNVGEVLNRIKNPAYLQTMADRAYTDLIASGRYAQSKLASVVQEELQALISPKCRPHDEVLSALSQIKTKYLLQNKLRCFYTEVSFIGANFMRLLFVAPNGEGASKWRLLADGAKRYLSYLTPRLRKSRA